MKNPPPISDHALLGDGHGAALVSRAGAIAWCCLPRFDSGSCFSSLLDPERGGACAITPAEAWESSREYEPDTLILVTSFRTEAGEARLVDLMVRENESVTPGAAPRHVGRQILRIVEGERGTVRFDVRVEPRFDYGAIAAWIRHDGEGRFTAFGGNDALLIGGGLPLERDGDHALVAGVDVHAGERHHLWLGYARPEDVDPEAPPAPDAEELQARLERTRQNWAVWAERLDPADGVDHAAVRRSAVVLQGLTYAPTGAIAAAATTSLPETPGGSRNWDYRYTWIRDSSFAVRSLAEIGAEEEALAFRRFVQRSSAGSAEDLQVLFGVGGERRSPEVELELAGYGGAKPVRVGNGAAGQLQLDAFGELVSLTWRWHARGHAPDDDGWRFLLSLVDFAAEHWQEPDQGIWEWRGEPRHFTHSKACCFAALDRGLQLAEECMRQAPKRRWQKARTEVRDAIEAEGYDSARGVFRQAFGRDAMDGALLLLPLTGFVDWDDPRMVCTTDAVAEELSAGDGLLYRYREDDGLEGQEGAFLACSFWLVENLARQGRGDRAREVFDAVSRTASDIGLFSEEWDPERDTMLGNVPQALTHLSHIAAAVALRDGAS